MYNEKVMSENEMMEALMKGDVEAYNEYVEETEEEDTQKKEETKKLLEKAVEEHETMREFIAEQDYAFTDLNDKQLEVAKDVSKSLSEDDLTQLSNFGVLAQEQMGNFSEQLLLKVKGSGDIKQLESDMTHLLGALKTNKKGAIKATKPTFMQRLRRPREKQNDIVENNFKEIAEQVETVRESLLYEKDVLLEDVHALEELYKKNRGYYLSTNVFIAAGLMKLETLVNETIPELLERAVETGSAQDVQHVNDVISYMNRLEKRVYDLKLTRQISIQQAPQIKIAQNTNQQLAEKINSSVNIAIPAWKQQIALLTTLGRQRQSLDLQQNVSDTTNKLLRGTADLLHDSTIAVAKENERGIVDVETLEYTQEKLFKTIGETVEIQREGRRKRMQVEKELIGMNDRMKQFLLSNASDVVEQETQGPIDVTPEDETPR